MPEYEITDNRTGKTLVVEGPRPPTPAEARDLFDRDSEVGISADPSSRVTEGMSGQDLGTLGIGGAVANIGRNLSRAGEFITSQLGLLSEADRQRFAESREFDADLLEEVGDDPNFLRGRIIGSAGLGAAIPGGAAGGIARRIGTGALGGATAAAATTAPDESVFRNVLIGGGAGALAPVVVNAVTSAISRLSNRAVTAVNPDGSLTDEAIELLETNRLRPDDLADATRAQLQREGVLTDEQARRFNLFRELDMDPTRAQVTRGASDFQAEQEAAKTTGAVNARLAEQDESLIARTEDLIPESGDAFDAGISVQNAVIRPQQALDEEIQGLYRAARESLPDAEVGADRLVRAVARREGQDRLSGGVVSGVQGELRNRGLLDGGRIGLDEAEELRQTINTFFDSATPRGRQLIAEFKESLDNDVMRVAGRDAFRQARAARRQFSERMERGRQSRFDTSRGSIVEDILTNNLEADNIVGKVVSRGTTRADINQLVTFLRDTGEGAAVENLKSGVLQNFLDAATRSNTRTSTGGLIFNGNAFARALDRFRPEKLQELFTPEEIRQINLIREVGELRIPTQRTATGQGPTAQAVGQIVDQIPILNRFAALTRIGRSAREARRALSPLRETERAIRPRGVGLPVSGATGGAVGSDPEA